MTSTSGQSEAAKRYATAFLDLVFTGNADASAIENDMRALADMAAHNADFAALAVNPLLRRADQAQTLTALADEMKFQPLTKKLLGTLAENRRLADLGSIADAVLAGLAERRGEVTAEAVSAQELTPEQARKIEDALAKGLGAKIRLVSTVDPAIMGGVILRVGSKLIDNSVRTRLERLHRAMKNPGAAQDQKKMKEVA